MDKDAVVLIPSYEPDNLLTQTVKSILDEGFDILLVNDGSSEEYDCVFNEVISHVKYIKQPVNKGKGAALKLGFSKIGELFPNAKYVITADGDGQHLTKDIVRVYNALKEKDELVFGVRHFDRKVPFRSRFGNEWSKFDRSLLTKQYIPDDQCGLRGFPVRYIDELVKIKGNRYEYEMNQITSFQLKQYPIFTVSIETVYLDGNSRSHFSPFLDTVRIQTVIFLHSIPSIICFAALLVSLLLLYSKGYTFYNFVIILLYSIEALTYFLVSSLINKSKTPFRKLAKELLFTAIRMAFCFAFVSLALLIKIPYQVAIPVGMVLASGFNVLLSWAFRKMYRTEKN